VSLRLLVDHCLFLHPDQPAQLSNHLPAYTVGSRRVNVQVECLVDVIQALGSSDDPQSQLHHFTQALREVFVHRTLEATSGSAPTRTARTHAVREVSGGRSHADHASAVNLKKLEDRVDSIVEYMCRFV
jgi:hypothetical protein